MVDIIAWIAACWSSIGTLALLSKACFGRIFLFTGEKSDKIQ